MWFQVLENKHTNTLTYRQVHRYTSMQTNTKIYIHIIEILHNSPPAADFVAATDEYFGKNINYLENKRLVGVKELWSIKSEKEKCKKKKSKSNIEICPKLMQSFDQHLVTYTHCWACICFRTDNCPV